MPCATLCSAPSDIVSYPPGAVLLCRVGMSSISSPSATCPSFPLVVASLSTPSLFSFGLVLAPALSPFQVVFYLLSRFLIMSVYQVIPDHCVQLDCVFLPVACAAVFERACPYPFFFFFFSFPFSVFPFFFWSRHPRHLSFAAVVLLFFLIIDSFFAGVSASD